MTIKYAAVYDAQTRVADWSTAQQSPLAESVEHVISTVSHHVYRRKTLDDSKGSGVHIHYISTVGGQVFVAAATPDMRAHVVFQFLDLVEQSFQNDSKKMGKVLAEKAEFFNARKNDKLSVLHKEIDNVKDIMLKNMDSVIARGEHLDAMAQKSTQLVDDATSFQRTATRIKRIELARRIKMIFILILAFAAFITVILMIACKPNFSRCR
mmetsp:Transcript_11556/g.17508  ORF Transcript_11556/g.17508 Transcript_11556/m.17508 type:complete len:210 (-) Transcript_11556:27-656(-)|eukprot:CAMPEP_0201522398 /NCGR_PEP_ID=MMETSP0161_2-20130828/17269_1 /ASSEMBLY_ACC=CAM_ASM_000251 /TAXON_ID=180227 /ORGANISM="Neoparamoeba aestuarina, Strain SoJaBio B1-5/56/2" /LENGTH=209 /DNA_ID=CAMNT_0047921233 /DNA_START=27 /DNA_END=656 /DNA_ORIENTATION=+